MLHLQMKFSNVFLKENVWIAIKISLKFVPEGPNSNIPAMVQIIAWRRPGDKPLSEPVVVCLLTHICVTRTQWVKTRICRSHVQSSLYPMPRTRFSLNKTSNSHFVKTSMWYLFSRIFHIVVTHSTIWIRLECSRQRKMFFVRPFDLKKSNYAA